MDVWPRRAVVCVGVGAAGVLLGLYARRRYTRMAALGITVKSIQRSLQLSLFWQFI